MRWSTDITLAIDLDALAAAGSRLLVIDDRGETATPAATVVLNHNPYATPAMYAHLGGGPRLLLGRDYVLLRREFRARTTRASVRSRAVARRCAGVVRRRGSGEPDAARARGARADRRARGARDRGRCQFACHRAACAGRRGLRDPDRAVGRQHRGGDAPRRPRDRRGRRDVLGARGVRRAGDRDPRRGQSARGHRGDRAARDRRGDAARSCRRSVLDPRETAPAARRRSADVARRDVPARPCRRCRRPRRSSRMRARCMELLA